MEMEQDHHQHQHHHHHEQQHQHYGLITDLRQLMNNAPSMHLQPQFTAELFPGHHRNLPPPLAATTSGHHQHYEMMMFGCDMMPRGLHHHHHHEFASTDSAAAAAAGGGITTTSVSSGLEAEAAGCIGGDASTGRWPRQETLTLLEIRSRLDPKFKETIQKGPLWEEVSRIMSEEYGYQRSGKKCREKFENLYKYYKKTKEGKAGRQDGKHYRFFRQLEALYGENTNISSSQPETSFGGVNNIGFNTIISSHHHVPSQQTNQEKTMVHSHSISLTNSTEFDTSLSSDHNSIERLIMENVVDDSKKRKSGGRRRSWKVKIKDFIDSQMRKLVEKQEEWLHKLVKTLEEKENERVLREEEWRKQEAMRLEKEHKFWAKERAWIEARDAALMDALKKLTGREIKAQQGPHQEGVIMEPHEIQNQNQNEGEISEIVVLNDGNVVRGGDCWQESEVTRLQQLKDEVETNRFTQSGYSEEVYWEEVANKMACFGYERSALMCKEKWESINNYDDTMMEGNIKKMHKGKYSRSPFYFDENNIGQYSLYNNNNQGGGTFGDVNDQRYNTNK